jgi:hypothetical protein
VTVEHGVSSTSAQRDPNGPIMTCLVVSRLVKPNLHGSRLDLDKFLDPINSKASVLNCL